MEIVDEKTGVTSLTIEAQLEAQLKKTRRFRKSETLDEDLTPEAREKKELEKKTKYKGLTKEEADTMVCDGAKLNLFSFSYN